MKRSISSPPVCATPAADAMGRGLTAIYASMRGIWSTGVATWWQAACASSKSSYSGCTVMASFSLS